MRILWGLLGITILMAIAFCCSNNRRQIKWRAVLLSLGFEILFAVLVLLWAPGRIALNWLTSGVERVINYANQGIDFLFGPLVQLKGSIFALQVLPVIIFLGALIGILFYLRVIQWVIQIVGGAVQWLLGTSKLESLSAISTVFLGQSEAPLLIRPYVARLTEAELFQVMTCGFTSVAGSTLVGYALLGIPLPYLLTACIMTAPAALCIGKLMFPETGEPLGSEAVRMESDEDSANVIDAAAAGTLSGLKLAVNVGALLLAFISLIALINGILGGVGGWFGAPHLTLQRLLGYLFSPVAWVIGVPWQEAVTAGGFIGEKIALNEFVAYTDLGPKLHHLSTKTAAIVTFALCGFANFSSVAIQIGTFGGLAPSRRRDVARLSMRALLAGTLANLMNAAIAGMVIG
ncbi:NupC/NupG family nucleoside CNT transporter [Alicyclobacillus fastidiosus]|uniref:Nucleoside permease n=1 Tax=Alicyclobacillus fastidiosus TaxID=392011 RepID=A0ABY6ZKH5_9BACL|nr:NupC/NupG family nucleoside CNT transporter [Alicyclobacillus fastidiosus]WAH42611.1 NupC/NupG family nucleoside CNT transporter [Alicyclobacillus fastidiosus]